MEVIYVTILIIVLLLVLYYFTTIKKETFENTDTSKIVSASASVPDVVIEEVIGSNVTYPNAKNPFMNVLVDEIKYNPTRGPAASVLEPSVQGTLEDYFKTQWVNDPTDVFNRSQSQRQFFTTPSTTVPNDVDSYQNWLYRIPGLSCKEGGREACAQQSGSAGAAIPFLTEN